MTNTAAFRPEWPSTIWRRRGLETFFAANDDRAGLERKKVPDPLRLRFRKIGPGGPRIPGRCNTLGVESSCSCTPMDFWRDFNVYHRKGVVFVRPPTEEVYGTVAVFRDRYGKLWDLWQLE